MENCIKLLIPRACPVELVRIGGTKDGSYLVPNDLEGIDACFSPGVNNFKDFEDTLTTTYNIRCHMCDFSSDTNQFKTPLIKGMQTFSKKWLDIDGGIDSISLEEWVRQYSPDQTKDLILQIDIEGAEYRNLNAASTDTLNRFRIIVIELHELGAFRNQGPHKKAIESLLKKLSASHICVHAHPNNCCGDFIDESTGLNIPNVFEITYLRRDRFTGDKSMYIQPQLPHPLDIDWNVRHNPPIHLNEAWLDNQKRSPQSEIKALRDKLDFAHWQMQLPNKLHAAELENLQKLHRLSLLNLRESSQLNKQLEDLTSLITQKTDLALGKQYILTEAYTGYPREGIVRKDPRFFFHTAIGINQRITIDLDDVHDLSALLIENRTDACQERASCLFCIVHSDQSGFTAKDILPIFFTDDFLTPSAYNTKSITPLLGRKGRFLSIFSPLHTALHFSSISVF